MTLNLIFATPLKYILVISTIFEVLKIKMTRHFIITFLLIFFCAYVYAQQQPDSLKQYRTDTPGTTLKDTSRLITHSHKSVVHPIIRPDTSGISLTDTSRLNIDSLKTVTHPVVKPYQSVVDSLLS